MILRIRHKGLRKLYEDDHGYAQPPHPGEIIREDCLKPLGLTVGKAAQGLGINGKHLSDILNGHAGISPEMAIRLSKAFGGSPESWLKQQMMYDLWQAERTTGDLEVVRFRSLKWYKGKVKLDVDLDVQRKRGAES